MTRHGHAPALGPSVGTANDMPIEIKGAEEQKGQTIGPSTKSRRSPNNLAALRASEHSEKMADLSECRLRLVCGGRQHARPHSLWSIEPPENEIQNTV
jgi:hypothetical protein